MLSSPPILKIFAFNWCRMEEEEDTFHAKKVVDQVSAVAVSHEGGSIRDIESVLSGWNLIVFCNIMVQYVMVRQLPDGTEEKVFMTIEKELNHKVSSATSQS